jgi:hypothetical protein
MSAPVFLPTLSLLLVAMEENLHGRFAYVQRRLPGMIVEEGEDLLLDDSGLQADTFNQIVRARFSCRCSATRSRRRKCATHRGRG